MRHFPHLEARAQMSLYAADAATYTRSPEQIVALYDERRKNRGLVMQQMEQFRMHYNGEVVVPLPELDRDERSSVANLVQMGCDSYGSRIASRMPTLECPAADPRKATALAKADIRRRANLAWWEENNVRRMMHRRARWFVGYAAAPATLRPDFERGIPRWEPRNPLTAFPAPTLNPDDVCSPDTIFSTLWTKAQLRRSYPNQVDAVCDPQDTESTPYTVLEYDDAEQITTILVAGPTARAFGSGHQCAVLESVPNRTGLALSTHPGRITLDRPLGQFDGILGMVMTQNKLMSLEVIAITKGVFPREWLVSRPGESARFISGPHEGSSGLINEVEGGEPRETATNPAFATLQNVDRLERSMRVAAGIPAEFGGESPTNVRTGKRGDNVLSSTIDFPIQEAQEVLAAALEEENRRATKISKAYFGNQAKSFHVAWKGAKGHVTYTPNKDFDSDYTQVTYPMAGSDQNNFVIGGGQRLGLGTLSKQSFMKMDPYVDDADLEGDLVTKEGLHAALLQSLQQQAASGTLPPADMARIIQLNSGTANLDLVDAVLKAQAEAQERQASVTADGEPDAVDPLSPAAQPGLAAPEQGAEAGAAVQDSGPSLSNLASFLQDMRSSSRGAGAAA